MYYANPDNDLLKISDNCCTMGMDVVQLLLLMDGVFQQQDYKICRSMNQFYIAPVEDKKDVYEEMVIQSDDELRKAMVLDERKIDFSSDDYKNISEYDNISWDTRDNLYYLNVLVHHINGNKTLAERKSEIFYWIFNNKNGKDFISWLFTMLGYLATQCYSTDEKGVNDILTFINETYKSMKEIYAGRFYLLQKMFEREKDIQKYYRHYFVNESSGFIECMKDRSKGAQSKRVLDFVFYKNVCNKKLAGHIMWHIIKISRFLGGKNAILSEWENELSNWSDKNQSMEFYHLNNLLNELDNRGTEFDKITWADTYLKHMNLIYRKHNL